MKLCAIFLAGVLFNYTTLTGFSSAYYDRRQRKLIQPRWLQAIVILQNLVIIILVPIGMIDNMRRKVPGAQQQLISKYVTMLSGFIQPCVAFFTIVTRPYRERRMLEIISDLLELEENFFRHMPEEIKRKCSKEVHELDKVLVCKGMCMLAFTLVYLVFAVHTSTHDNMWANAAYIWMAAYKTNITIGATYHAFAVVCHMNKRWAYVNAAIDRGLTNDMRCDQLMSLLLRQTQLKRLLERLNATYRYSFFFSRLGHIVNSITCGYWLVYDIWLLDTVAMNTDLAVTMLTASLMYTLYVGEMYLSDCIAENFIDAQRQTNELFRFYASCTNLPKEIERLCEWYSLQRSLHLSGLNIFGVYSINRRQTFTIISFIFLYTIFIVQSDYKHF